MFGLASLDFGSNGGWRVRAYRASTLTEIVGLDIPKMTGYTPSRLVRWGTKGLAWIAVPSNSGDSTKKSKIFLLDTAPGL